MLQMQLNIPLQASVAMARSLTIGEKILFHLSRYLKAEEKYEVPFDVTQDGIAQSCGISRAHAAIELKKLREGDLLLEKLSHVKRAKSRRKVYFLTQTGKAKASKIVEFVNSESVDPGIDPSRISQDSGTPKRVRRHRMAVPQPKFFIGREKELSDLRAITDDASIDIVLVSGIGGIGKTSLLSKFTRESKFSVLWFSFSEWETEYSLLKTLANFLEETGDNRLSNYIKSERTDLGEISYLIGESLADNRKMLIFDDVDRAPRLHDFIHMIIDNLGPTKLIMSSENRIPLVEKIANSGKHIAELKLSGLERENALELLSRRKIKGDSAKTLCELTGCHPLLLELVPGQDELTAKVELSNYVKNNFLKDLSSMDIALIEKCAVFRKPFNPNFLSRDERHILQLPIFNSISGKVIMHDLARNIVIDQIPEDELREYHSRAADYYLSEGEVSERLHHLIMSGRSLESEMLIHRHFDELLSMDAADGFSDELSKLPPSLSKYAPSVRLLKASLLSNIGNEAEAISSLKSMIESEEGDNQAEAVIQLSWRKLDASLKTDVVERLRTILADEKNSEIIRAKAAQSLSHISFSDGDFDECDASARQGVMLAGRAFALDIVSDLNRMIAQVLVFREAYPSAISFITQVAPCFSDQHRPLYCRLLGKSALESGKIDLAIDNLSLGAQLAEQMGQYKELSDILVDLGNAKAAKGDLDGAAEACYQCIEVSSSLNETINIAAAYSLLSEVERERGNEEESVEARETAESLTPSIEFEPSEMTEVKPSDPGK
ncbi:MAG TPA: hypothetical protein ENN25_07275 [Euryarchaeota archaeon]|nr:hypothetical protein [Euryarchaeota archaeon]